MEPVPLRPSLGSLARYAIFVLANLVLLAALYEASAVITMFLLWLLDMLTHM